METLNAALIKGNQSPEYRIKYLRDVANEQKIKLDGLDIMKSIKKESETTYIDVNLNTQPNVSKFNQKLKKGLDYNPKEDNKKKD